MKEIKTEIIINASADKVWDVLTDFEDYLNWNPFIKWVKGNVEINNKIIVRMEPPGANGMTFKPQVLKFDKNKEFSWIGHLFITGLFDGEHIFELYDMGNGTTKLVQREQFRGILIPLLKKMLDLNTKQGFELMNKALKERAEK
ncbi:MAG: SRPBCC family protein [Bacteroidia bacterium]